uniref:Pentraxin (PTX) domain-containing protein n=1 Tax=Pelusios castaneus TaxID=367368 RepID=A0A8C8ST11_9SAUR
MRLAWAFLWALCWASSGVGEHSLPKFVCSPMPLEMEPGCQPAPQPRVGGHWAGTLEEAKETILHLRETVVHQKETILDQRETVRELTAKLSRCESNLSHGHREGAGAAPNTMEDPPREVPSGATQLERMLESLKERLEHLQVLGRRLVPPGPWPSTPPINPSPFTPSLPPTLPIDVTPSPFFTHPHNPKTSLPHQPSSLNPRMESPPIAFRVAFPLRTNYMYVKVKRTLQHEIFAFTVCLWLKSSSAPGVGTPFSYSVAGQANELVLIEWGNNPMELLINDKAATLPLAIHDGKWHHICVTWSTRDGIWESYQDGVRRGSGENLAPWHPIKSGGVFILGQEQDTLGGRFDATQAFIGELADFNIWSHVLAPGEVYRLATCASYTRGDLVAWAESTVELHGGVSKLPFNACH